MTETTTIPKIAPGDILYKVCRGNREPIAYDVRVTKVGRVWGYLESVPSEGRTRTHDEGRFELATMRGDSNIGYAPDIYLSRDHYRAAKEREHAFGQIKAAFNTWSGMKLSKDVTVEDIRAAAALLRIELQPFTLPNAR